MSARVNRQKTSSELFVITLYTMCLHPFCRKIDFFWFYSHEYIVGGKIVSHTVSNIAA